MSEPVESNMTWSVHPFQEQPGRAAVGSVWIIAVVLVLVATTGSVFWPVFAALFLPLMLNRFFFPSRFTLDEEGITASYPFRRERFAWADVKRFLHDDEGGLLSLDETPSRWHGSRNMRLMFGRHTEQAVRSIESRLRAMHSRESET